MKPLGAIRVDEFARAITKIHPGPAPDASSATHAWKPPTLLHYRCIRISSCDAGFRLWMIPDHLLGVMGRPRLGWYYVSASDRKYHKLYNGYDSRCHLSRRWGTHRDMVIHLAGCGRNAGRTSKVEGQVADSPTMGLLGRG